MLQIRIACAALGALLFALAPQTTPAQTTGTVTSSAGQATTSPGEAKYPNLCVVSGEELGSMGEPYTIQHEGRTVKFCCKACEKQFKEDPDKYLKKLDEAVISEQGKNYPSNVCVVSGKEIAAGEGKEIVVNNQMVRICCGGCEATVRADPEKFLGKLGGEKKQ